MVFAASSVLMQSCLPSLENTRKWSRMGEGLHLWCGLIRCLLISLACRGRSGEFCWTWGSVQGPTKLMEVSEHLPRCPLSALSRNPLQKTYWLPTVCQGISQFVTQVLNDSGGFYLDILVNLLKNPKWLALSYSEELLCNYKYNMKIILLED